MPFHQDFVKKQLAPIVNKCITKQWWTAATWLENKYIGSDTVYCFKTHNHSGDMQMINQDCFKVRYSDNLHLTWPLAKQINSSTSVSFTAPYAIRWGEQRRHMYITDRLTHWGVLRGYIPPHSGMDPLYGESDAKKWQIWSNRWITKTPTEPGARQQMLITASD